MADQPQVRWGDITVGQRAEQRRQRIHMDDWWKETADMVDRGYRRFWRKRGMEPPRVSSEILESGTTPVQLLLDDKLGPDKGRRGVPRRDRADGDDSEQL